MTTFYVCHDSGWVYVRWASAMMLHIPMTPSFHCTATHCTALHATAIPCLLYRCVWPCNDLFVCGTSSNFLCASPQRWDVHHVCGHACPHTITQQWDVRHVCVHVCPITEYAACQSPVMTSRPHCSLCTCRQCALSLSVWLFYFLCAICAWAKDIDVFVSMCLVVSPRSSH